MSIPLDIVVFVFVIVQTRLIKSMNRGVDVPSILDTINRDSGIYFALISSSHTLAVIMRSVTRVSFFTSVRV